MTIAVASGKGGTGKTTVAVNMVRSLESEAILVDSDVEEPNAHLFFAGFVTDRWEVCVKIPRVNETLCNGCGECGRFCEFNAIVSLSTSAITFPELCHSCGGCEKVCPRGAITETDRRTGLAEVIEDEPIRLVKGELDLGEAQAPPLIRAIRYRAKQMSGSRDIPIVIDAPPGTGCSMVTAVRDSDFVILVAEPTPFGLHDLELAVRTVRQLSLPFGVVINRSDSGDDAVHHYCRTEGIPLIAEIPENRAVAEVQARGGSLVDEIPRYGKIFRDIVDSVVQMTLAEGVGR